MPADGQGGLEVVSGAVGFLCCISHMAHGSCHQVAPRSQGQAPSQQKGALLVQQLWEGPAPRGGHRGWDGYVPGTERVDRFSPHAS